MALALFAVPVTRRTGGSGVQTENRENLAEHQVEEALVCNVKSANDTVPPACSLCAHGFFPQCTSAPIQSQDQDHPPHDLILM